MRTSGLGPVCILESSNPTQTYAKSIDNQVQTQWPSKVDTYLMFAPFGKGFGQGRLVGLLLGSLFGGVGRELLPYHTFFTSTLLSCKLP